MKIKLDFDITADEYNIINKILNDYLISVADNCTVYVFGSRAKNTARINSDLDLALELPDNNKISSNTIIDLKEAFDNSSLPYRVDIIDLNSVSDTFRELVNQDKKIFPLLGVTGIGMMSNHRPRLRFKADDGSDYPDWEENRLGDICCIKTGSSNRIDSNLDGQYVFFDRSEDIRTSNKFLFDSEAVIIPGEGQSFTPKYFVGKFDLHQRAYAIMNLKCVHMKFIYYLMQCQQEYLLSNAVGSTVKSLRLPIFQKMPILLPSLPEQQKIADFLTAVDDLITSTKQHLEFMKQYKQGVMQQVFSQKLRFKADNGSDYPDWEEKKLGDACIINPKACDIPSVFQYIDLESVENGELKQSKMLYADHAPSRAQRRVFKGDILYQTVRPYQKNNLFFELDGDYVASTGYAQIRTNYNARYVYYWIHTTNFVDEVMLRCTGTSYPAINSSDLSKILILLPSPHEQQKIADLLTLIDDSIQQQTSKLEQTELYKKSLLQQMLI